MYLCIKDEVIEAIRNNSILEDQQGEVSTCDVVQQHFIKVVTETIWLPSNMDPAQCLDFNITVTPAMLGYDEGMAAWLPTAQRIDRESRICIGFYLGIIMATVKQYEQKYGMEVRF